MNRIQFFVLTGLSSLVVLLLLGNILLIRQNNFEQNRLAAAQQVVTQGQSLQGNLKQLALRIYQDSQRTQDPGLKELLDRQQIKINAGPQTPPPAESPAPSPAPSTH